MLLLKTLGVKSHNATPLSARLPLVRTPRREDYASGISALVKHFPSLAAASLVLLASHVAEATPPATPLERIVRFEGAPAPILPPVHVLLTQTAAKAQMAEIAAWDVTMQSTSCAEPDAGLDAGFDACLAGGIIEVESGPGMAIIASDNTQEAIGVWNLNKTINGVAHASNITAAFDFLSTHPGYLAWQVAGDPGPDYYSVYNCGWGVRAVMLYESTTGDMTTHHAYGETCAQHIATNAANLITPSAELVDVGPAGWAASGLWLWGNTYPADAAMKTTAATIGGQVKTWLEAFPSRISSQQWSMSGGAPYYGVIESYMKENPSELVPWVTEYAPMLGGWIDESMPATPNDWTDWRNAWNAWNMLAQYTSAGVLGASAGSANAANAADILGKLVAQANPTTGAISGSQQRPNTEAESWITAYLVYFGLLQVIDAPSSTDAGVDAAIVDASAKDAGSSSEKDAGKTSVDAGSRHDANVAADAGKASEPSSGCSCGIAGAHGEEAALPLALVPLALFARRRPRTKR
jgi:hypothetical protein